MKIAHIHSYHEFEQDFFLFVDYFTHKRDFSMWHEHDFFEMVYIVAGTGYHKTLYNKIPLKPHSMYFLNRNEPHSYNITDELTIINCIFTPAFVENILRYLASPKILEYFLIQDFLNELPGGIRIVELELDKSLQINKILNKMKKEIQLKKSFFDEIVYMDFSRLLLVLYQNFLERKRHATFVEDYPQQYIEQIIKYIHQNYNSNISLEVISDKLQLSKTYISRIFKKKTGYALFEFLNNVRIQKSINLLADKKKSILQIAHEVGYNNISFYNRYFKKLNGISAREYRQLLHK